MKCTFQVAHGTPTCALYSCENKTPSGEAKNQQRRLQESSRSDSRLTKAMPGSSLREMDVTLRCLKHVWPSPSACWPEKLEHPQRAPSASSRCHTSQNQDALAKRVKMQTDPASQHAPPHPATGVRHL